MAANLLSHCALSVRLRLRSLSSLPAGDRSASSLSGSLPEWRVMQLWHRT